MNKPIIKTERLILRTMQLDDLDALTAISQCPDVMKYFPSTQTKEQVRDAILRQQQHQKKYGYSFYTVQLQSTNEIIGFVGIQQVDFVASFTPAVEIGWRLSASHWNKGYATEAARSVLDYAFNVLKLDEIISFTAVINSPSERVMNKIGMYHNSDDDFNHPKLPKEHALSRHVLYRLTRSKYKIQEEND